MTATVSVGQVQSSPSVHSTTEGTTPDAPALEVSIVILGLPPEVATSVDEELPPNAELPPAVVESGVSGAVADPPVLHAPNPKPANTSAVTISASPNFRASIGAHSSTDVLGVNSGWTANDALL